MEILEGKRLVHAHSYRADEIVMLLNVARDFGFRIASLQHVLEGYKVADEINAAGTGASTFADNWAYKLEAYDAIPHNAALMAERGVKVSINSDSDERARRLYQEAAKAIKYGGASEEEALRMITLNAAGQLGIADKTGSIDVGKDADIAIFSAHPFSPGRASGDHAGGRAAVLRPQQGADAGGADQGDEEGSPGHMTSVSRTDGLSVGLLAVHRSPGAGLGRRRADR